MTPKRIGFIGFDGVVAIDLVGPAEAFACAKVKEGENCSKPCYEVLTIAASNQPFVAESGVVFKPQKTFKNAPPLDTLIIPGGIALREPNVSRSVSAFVKAQAGQTRRIVSICTGIYGLAATGLLAGRKVTTHWRFAPDVARRFPDLRVHDNAIFLKDMADYAAMNAVYREYFPEQPPARYCIRADLVKPEFLVEIAATAHVAR